MGTADELEKELTPIVTGGGFPVSTWLGRAQPPPHPSAPAAASRPVNGWSPVGNGSSSFRSALGWSSASAPPGAAATSPSTGLGSALGSGSNSQPTTCSQGPRADLPEVGEAGDYTPYMGGGGGGTTTTAARYAPIPTRDEDSATYPGSTPRSVQAQAALPLPSTWHPRGAASTLSQATSGDDGPRSPLPTRLTTPGGVSLSGTMDPAVAGGYVYDQVGPGLYASRPAGRGT